MYNLVLVKPPFAKSFVHFLIIAVRVTLILVLLFGVVITGLLLHFSGPTQLGSTNVSKPISLLVLWGVVIALSTGAKLMLNSFEKLRARFYDEHRS
jgi:hypothetical protein